MTTEKKTLGEEIDLDGLDLDTPMEDLEDLNLEGFGEINETIDEPHIKMSSKELKEFLVVAKLVSVASGKDFVTKSVAFQVEEDKVIVRATDLDVYIEKSLELLNQEHVYAEPIVVPVDTLIKLMKAVPVNTVLFERDGQLYIRLVGGDMPLDTFKVAIDKFIFDDPLVLAGQVQSKDINLLLKDFSGVMNQAVNPAEKRIICTEDKAYVSYMWSAVSCSKTFSSMDFKSKDVNILRSLTSQREEVLQVYDTDPAVKVARKVVVGSNYRYSFMISTVKVPEATKQMLNKTESDSGVFVDLVQMYKMTELAADLPSSLGRIGFNYDENQNVIMNVLMKNAKTKNCLFTLSGNPVGENRILPTEIKVQAKMLRIILRAFSTFNSVKVLITPEGLGLAADDYSASVMVEQGK